VVADFLVIGSMTARTSVSDKAMAKGDFEALMHAVEAERLKLRESQSQTPCRATQSRMITPEFAREVDDYALIRGTAELNSIESVEAKQAATTLDPYRQFREGPARAASERHRFWPSLAALVAALVGTLALLGL
jgi:hypothetical protein